MTIHKYPIKDIYNCKITGLVNNGAHRCSMVMRTDPNHPYPLCGRQLLGNSHLYNKPIFTPRFVNQVVLGTGGPFLFLFLFKKLAKKVISSVTRFTHCDHIDMELIQMKVNPNPPPENEPYAPADDPWEPLPANARNIRIVYCGKYLGISMLIATLVVKLSAQIILPVTCELQYNDVPCPSITYAHTIPKIRVTYEPIHSHMAGAIVSTSISAVQTTVTALLKFAYLSDVVYCAAKISEAGPVDVYAGPTRFKNCLFGMEGIIAVNGLMPYDSLIPQKTPYNMLAFITTKLLTFPIFLTKVSINSNLPVVCDYPILPTCDIPGGCPTNLTYPDGGGVRHTTLAHGDRSLSGLNMYNEDNEIQTEVFDPIFAGWLYD